MSLKNYIKNTVAAATIFGASGAAEVSAAEGETPYVTSLENISRDLATDVLSLLPKEFSRDASHEAALIYVMKPLAREFSSCTDTKEQNCFLKPENALAANQSVMMTAMRLATGELPNFTSPSDGPYERPSVVYKGSDYRCWGSDGYDPGAPSSRSGGKPSCLSFGR